MYETAIRIITGLTFKRAPLASFNGPGAQQEKDSNQQENLSFVQKKTFDA